MKQQWEMYCEKVSQLQIREKYMLLGIGLFLILYLIVWFIITPLHDEMAKSKKQIKQNHQSLAQAKTKIDMFSHALTQDYTLQLRKELEQAKLELKNIDQDLSQFSQGFIPPYKMAQVLKQLLKVNQSLQLKSFGLEAVKPVVIGKENTENKTSTSKKNNVAFYEHSMALTIEGDYFSLLNYVKSLGKIKEKLFISQFQYQVMEYPQAELKLVIATVSADEKFIAL